MRIVISGGSGFIGTALVQRLLQSGHDVAVLTRNAAHVREGRPLVWDGRSVGAWAEEAGAADAIINLAGENIGAGRWTAERKRRIVASRVDATSALVEAVRRAPRRERVFVSASATGYYGSRGDEELTEESAPGSGFLADVTRQWEAAAAPAAESARLVIPRIGIVIGAGGGALASMLPAFRLGLGGPIGSGEQWMSWIEIDDLLRIFERFITDGAMTGAYNATAPNPVRNREFTKTLAGVLHRPHVMRVPGLVLKLAMGEMAGPMVLEGQRVLPSRLLSAQLHFGYDNLTSALHRHLIRA